MKRRHRLMRVAMLAALLVPAGMIACEAIISARARGRIHEDAKDVPPHRVGIVLGTGKRVTGGRPNLFFKYRIEAAVELFKSGKVQFLLVSGDNGSVYYDEATDMRDDLIEKGVPAEKIYRDFAGFRTLDSMVRAKNVFGLDDCIVISQRFHCERAIFLAGSCGLSATGLAARDVPGRYGLRAWVRERFARVAAVLDIYVIHRKPRFLGPQIRIGEDPPT